MPSHHPACWPRAPSGCVDITSSFPICNVDYGLLLVLPSSTLHQVLPPKSTIPSPPCTSVHSTPSTLPQSPRAPCSFHHRQDGPQWGINWITGFDPPPTHKVPLHDHLGLLDCYCCDSSNGCLVPFCVDGPTKHVLLLHDLIGVFLLSLLFSSWKWEQSMLLVSYTIQWHTIDVLRCANTWEEGGEDDARDNRIEGKPLLWSNKKGPTERVGFYGH